MEFVFACNQHFIDSTEQYITFVVTIYFRSKIIYSCEELTTYNGGESRSWMMIWWMEWRRLQKRYGFSIAVELFLLCIMNLTYQHLPYCKWGDRGFYHVFTTLIPVPVSVIVTVTEEMVVVVVEWRARALVAWDDTTTTTGVEVVCSRERVMWYVDTLYVKGSLFSPAYPMLSK